MNEEEIKPLFSSNKMLSAEEIEFATAKEATIQKWTLKKPCILVSVIKHKEKNKFFEIYINGEYHLSIN